MGKIIVTGCGRSGTYYIQLVLESLGLKVGHERWGEDGFVGFHVAGDLKAAAINRPWRTETSPDDVILHQVRHPLPTISSLQTMKDYSWDFVSNYMPVKTEEPKILKCMKYWYHWNLLAEGHACYTYQVEQLPQVWPVICKLVGLDPSTPLPKESSKMRHKRGHTNLKWSHLKKIDIDLKTKIVWLARHYGYKP